MQNYFVHFDVIAKMEDYHEDTRELATALAAHPYDTLERFFTTVSDEYLGYMLDLCDIADHDDPRVDELIVVTLMLIQAEGVIIDTYEAMIDRVEQFKMMCGGIELARQGVVQVKYENLSFGEDMYDKIVFIR